MPASPTAARGPISRAENSTAPQTIVTLAPDTAVRCVKPAVRNSWPVTGVTVDMSPSTSAGSIAAWSAGSTRRAAAANPARTVYAVRFSGPARPIVGAPIAVTTATLRSRRVGAVIRARKRIGWPTITAPKSRAGAKTTARPDVSWSSELSQRGAEQQPTVTDRDRAFGRCDGHLHGGTECGGYRVVRDCVGAQCDRESEARSDHSRSGHAGADRPDPGTSGPEPPQQRAERTGGQADRPDNRADRPDDSGGGHDPTGQRRRHQACVQPRCSGIGGGWLRHRPQTRTSGRSFSSRPGPMPSTSPSWSTLVNLPLA